MQRLCADYLRERAINQWRWQPYTVPLCSAAASDGPRITCGCGAGRYVGSNAIFNGRIDASFDELVTSPMAINVHESAANIGKYVACGDIL